MRAERLEIRGSCGLPFAAGCLLAWLGLAWLGFAFALLPRSLAQLSVMRTKEEEKKWLVAVEICGFQYDPNQRLEIDRSRIGWSNSRRKYHSCFVKA
jgi:hypothetical protein